VHLEISGEICDVGVGHRVRFVEAVLGERHDLVPQLTRLVLGVALGRRAGDEVFALPIDDLLLLLAHRLAQGVGLGERETGDLDGNSHHLLLVDDDAVGLAEDFLELGKNVGDGLAAVLALRVVIDELHGAGPVEGVERRDVEKALRLHSPQHVLHARRLELKDPVGITGGEKRVHRRVVERDLAEIKIGVFGTANRLDCVVDHRQSAESEKVHLQQTERLDVVLVELGADLAVGGANQGHEIDQRLGRDDHARSVDAAVTGEPLQPRGRLHEQTDVIVRFHKLPQLRRILERLFDCDIEFVRNQLGYSVHIPKGHSYDPPDVSHRGLRLENVECRDLRHRILTI